MTSRHLALALADDLSAHRPKGLMLRRIRQFIMDADEHEQPDVLIADPAPATGDRRWDALVAGVVEDIAFRHRTATPAWSAAAEGWHRSSARTRICPFGRTCAG